MNQPPRTETSVASLPWIREAFPLVRRIAASLSRRAPTSMSMEDLVSAGFVALVAEQRRRPDLSPEQLVLASASRVRGAMLDELRNVDPLSRRTRSRVRAVDRATASFEARHGRTPTDLELAGSLGISAGKATEARVVGRRAKNARAEGGSDNIAETSAGPEEQAHRRQRLQRFATAVESLPGRQRRVVELYFGEEQTLRQVGDLLGVTEARVSQILSGAVKQLRVSCASMPPPAA